MRSFRKRSQHADSVRGHATYRSPSHSFDRPAHSTLDQQAGKAAGCHANGRHSASLPPNPPQYTSPPSLGDMWHRHRGHAPASVRLDQTQSDSNQTESEAEHIGSVRVEEDDLQLDHHLGTLHLINNAPPSVSGEKRCRQDLWLYQFVSSSNPQLAGADYSALTIDYTMATGNTYLTLVGSILTKDHTHVYSVMPLNRDFIVVALWSSTYSVYIAHLKSTPVAQSAAQHKYYQVPANINHSKETRYISNNSQVSGKVLYADLMSF